MNTFFITNNNTNNSSSYSNHLLGKLWNRYPKMMSSFGMKSPNYYEEESSSLPFETNLTYAGPVYGFQPAAKKHSLFDSNFDPNAYINDLNNRNNSSYLYNRNHHYTNDNALHYSYNAAMKKLDDYARRNRMESYDFMLPDGTGVNVHDAFIQVGSTIIPKYVAPNYFSSYPATTIVVIKKIITTINTFVIAA